MLSNLLDWFKLVKRPFGLCIMHPTACKAQTSQEGIECTKTKEIPKVLLSNLYTVLGVQRQFTVFQIIS